MSDAHSTSRGKTVQSGDSFGRWKTISRERRGKQYFWYCECRCGTFRAVRETHLRSGLSTSCGCYMREAASASSKTHGKSKTPEYGVWCGIINRCENTNDGGYKKYGAKGVSVCRRWRESFEAFISDMGERPSRTHSIDRIDPHGNYEPGNCRWATRKEQGRNRKDTVFVTYNGIKLSLADLAEQVGIKRATLYRRIVIAQMTVDLAISTPVLRRHEKGWNQK